MASPLSPLKPDNPNKKRKTDTNLFKIRLATAILALILFLIAYLSPVREQGGPVNPLMGAQFSLSLLRGGRAIFIVVAVLSLTAVFGRLYCSVACPMGTIQEVFWRIFRAVAGKNRGRYIRPWKARLAVPLLAGIGIVTVFPPLMIVLDPLSVFGRGITSVVGAMSGFYAPSFPIVLSLAVFVCILAVSAIRGRRFCDWCPVGIVLGFASAIAPYSIKLEKSRCTSCGVCEKKCPMNCIDSAAKRIDSERCVLCLNCAASCPGSFIHYAVSQKTPAGGRRSFIRTVLYSAIGVVYLGSVNMRIFASRVALGLAETRPLRGIMPPGAGNDQRYAAHCVACQACASACPVGIIGMEGSMQPTLRYTNGYCQYNCSRCSEVCPTNAIRRIGIEEKRRTRIALSSFIRERCVVVEKSQACGACAEVCPTRALRMEPYGGMDSGLTIPVFEEPYCIGCGACVFACPARPLAFVMHPTAVQTLTPGMRPTGENEGGVPLLPDVDEFPF